MSTMRQPDDLASLQAMLAEAHARREPVGRLDLSRLDAIVDFSPEDMTATVQTGRALGALQARLAEAGQWLPVDPPHADETPVADVLHHDLSGPRRYGYGTVREHVIGIAAVLADGRLVRSGGRVVKNVAGYDLARLLVGSGGSLGLIVEATFKLRPTPEAETFVQWQSPSLDDVDATLESVLAGPTDPVVLDIVRRAGDADWLLVAGYAGHPADVSWQLSAAPAGWQERGVPDYDTDLCPRAHPRHVVRRSVAPAALVATLRSLPEGLVVARAGNGVIYTPGTPEPVDQPVPTLARRVRDAFDPHRILAGVS